MTLQELLKFASVSNLHPFVPPCHSLYFLSQSTFYYRHFQLPTVLIMPWTSSCSYLQLMLNFFCLVLILNDIFPPPQSLSCFPLHAGYFTQHSRYTSQGIYSVATVGTIFKYRQSPSLKIKVFSHLFFHSLSNSFLPQHLAQALTQDQISVNAKWRNKLTISLDSKLTKKECHWLWHFCNIYLIMIVETVLMAWTTDYTKFRLIWPINTFWYPFTG